ncbi:MAG: hypothetical protein KF688_05055 [Pirellulales bacterium]|nr:hypothetical protein [Pirellulales bacterium]
MPVRQPPRRRPAVDVYRGLAMLPLAFLDGPRFDWWERIAGDEAAPRWARALARQFEHVEWAGLSLWDFIQPSFMFLVGTSLALSAAARRQAAQSPARMWGHAAYRAAALVLLGVFLRSIGEPRTAWRFDDVVSQIGLGYLPLFALRDRSNRTLLAVTGAILAGYWLLYAAWPLPPAGFDWAAVQGQAYYDGFAAHWNKNADPARAFDAWLLNLFPRAASFVANGGGYHTLNFVPSLATMLLGLVAGNILQGSGTRPGAAPLREMLVLAGACLAFGLILHATGVCPCVKRIWTPSFALVAGGLSLACLAACSWLFDEGRLGPRWAMPATVVGRNPIAAYAMVHTLKPGLLDILHCHLGEQAFAALGDPYAPLLENLAVGACIWGVCWWMARRKIYLRL